MHKKNDFITLDSWEKSKILDCLKIAQSNLNKSTQQQKNNLFKNMNLINLFFENSTRTRCSFEIAAKNLGMNVINISVESSSVKKGESFKDTLLTLDAMCPEIMVIRHKNNDAAHFASKILKCCVVNAGSGVLSHPSQALLDTLTIIQEKGKLEGLNIGICGDLLHSRVAQSDIRCFTKLGANVRLIAPQYTALKDTGLPSFTDMEKGLQDLDVIIMLRIQKERIEQSQMFSIEQYKDLYCLTQEKLALAKKDCIVMHPGPINRGIEITDEVADGLQSRILTQVKNGVAVRMAIFETLLG